MQPPTCVGIRVRSPLDAITIIHAVHLGILPLVHRRLDTDERRAIQSGSVYVWEERGPNAEATGLGIERWTDSISWGPSRVRDEFLFYHERKPAQPEPDNSTDSSDTNFQPRYYYRKPLVKQTYSVFVRTHTGRRKWHLIAYFTQDTVDQLRSIEDHPQLRGLNVPDGLYVCARSAKGRPRHSSSGSIGNYPIPTDPILTYPALYPPRVPLRAINPTERLAPLAYLKRVPPPRRHAVDQMALMSFSGLLTSDESIRKIDIDSEDYYPWRKYESDSDFRVPFRR
ncbi:cAMP-independent regulatory protein pac2 [Psilocybe cubensis]|uniref:Gti1/Pac2 family-domain-containing protein n=2 Tax=Psilocybe cubensis TaxID=181762 RepID=A0A8H7Y7D4_PSICU|nr:cAMP-independent regulatory protein pac2 [Psilocybe cubensis]KAH9485084.1 cAMP-independent regulatory protein pac2 [Psilocybe cubensis]